MVLWWQTVEGTASFLPIWRALINEVMGRVDVRGDIVLVPNFRVFTFVSSRRVGQPGGGLLVCLSPAGTLGESSDAL